MRQRRASVGTSRRRSGLGGETEMAAREEAGVDLSGGGEYFFYWYLTLSLETTSTAGRPRWPTATAAAARTKRQAP